MNNTVSTGFGTLINLGKRKLNDPDKQTKTKYKSFEEYEKHQQYSEWMLYQLLNLYLTAVFNPGDVGKQCKELEKICQRKKDKTTLVTVRKKNNPADYLLSHAGVLLPIIEEGLTLVEQLNQSNQLNQENKQE